MIYLFVLYPLFLFLTVSLVLAHVLLLHLHGVFRNHNHGSNDPFQKHTSFGSIQLDSGKGLPNTSPALSVKQNNNNNVSDQY